MEIEDKKEEGLVIGLLDFPKGGTFGLDGQSIVLKTDDFLGVKNVPRNAFHLVTCKNGYASKPRDDNNSNTIDTAVTVGFILFGNDTDVNNGHLVRRYDPQTEEVASEKQSPVDTVTKRNLVQQMRDGSLPPTRVLQYEQIVSGGGNTSQEMQSLSQQGIWGELTRYIGEALLKDLRGLSSGDKIVPGCYDPENEINNRANLDSIATKETDGKSLRYPPIPVVNPKLSLAKHKHHGTNRFLSRLAPQERTKLFLSPAGAHDSNTPIFVWLDRVLDDYYRGSWESLLGDLQLSYLLFLYLGCYSSLGHWKDLLAMLSLAVDGFGGENQQRPKHKHESLYRGLLQLLPYQLSSMTDPEFLEDVDEGGGNFLVPSLVRLKRYYETEEQSDNNIIVTPGEEKKDDVLLSKFRHVLYSKFPRSFSFRPSLPTITRIRSNSDISNNSNANANDNANQIMEIDAGTDNCDWGDDDDEDGPVVVSSEDIEASMARSSTIAPGTAKESMEVSNQLRREYPFLAAAMMPSEDVLMTCARVLDEKKDVTLVREAAAYLEEVEQKRGYF